MSKTTVTEKAANPDVLTIKSFRANSDIENFYRYIHENGLRREAYLLMDYALSKVSKGSKAKKGRRSKTLQ